MLVNPFLSTTKIKSVYGIFMNLWHPCSQMKDYETFKPIEVSGASAEYIELKNGKKIIDAISSWWSKSLGHNHPLLKQALIDQIEKFEHVILANTINDNISLLTKRLTNLTSSLKKVKFASDGSCAVEIALKMSLHSRLITGSNKTKFIALKDGYHGETIGALSVSDQGLYRKPYSSLLFDVNFISNIPYVYSIDDPLWHDSSQYWNEAEQFLAPLANQATALILEPIVQGAAGMRIYSQDFLSRLQKWCNGNDVHLIADEIMTGIGRTGKMLACQHANIEPDFMCLAKGLTSGYLPLSAVLINNKIYDIFYDDYEKGKSFLHSHTHSGNALAVSVALETLNIIIKDQLIEQSNQIGKIMFSNMQEIAYLTKKLCNVRYIGAIVAADLICKNPSDRAGYRIYQNAIKLGALLRPIGNTIYWLPPLIISNKSLEDLKNITLQAILLEDF